MRKGGWRKRIRAACELVGVNPDECSILVEGLAETLDKRDRAGESFTRDTGGMVLIEYTNKAGATNYTKNPALQLWNDLNTSALAQMREMGITPASLKKIGGVPQKDEKSDPLTEALNRLDLS